MSVAIVDYGSGNLRSAQKAFEHVVRGEGLDCPVHVTCDPEMVAKSDRIVLPGVGAFRDCKRGLYAVPGMVDMLVEQVRHKAKPFLGICVGMQLMATRGLEHGSEDGLGWIDGDVARIEPADPALKIPHMGWNTLDLVRPHVLLEGITLGGDGLHAYFVHSYAFDPARDEDLVARADHGGPVTAMIARDNMAGTQFHPEKSQELGLRLIANFLRWRP